jgi:Integrase core domain/Cobalamin-independent synthase, Catalytic domain
MSTYRADQVGSLLRPPGLLELHKRETKGGPAKATLRQREDEAISEVLQRQQAIGLDVYVDGEFRRTGFMTGFRKAVVGFKEGEPAPLPWQGGASDEPPSVNARILVDKLAAHSRIAQDEASYLKEHAPGADITYISTWEGFLYLAHVQDLFSRLIAGWSMADHLRSELVVSALEMALARRRPDPGLVHHSDQGCPAHRGAVHQTLREGRDRGLDRLSR